jgi:hypothetical protein
MKFLVLSLSLAVLTSPSALAAPPPPDEPITIAEAASIMAAIKSTPSRIEIYCQIQDLFAKADEALQLRDETTADRYLDQAARLTGELGDDYERVIALSAELAPGDDAAEVFLAARADLNKTCAN